MNEPLSIWDRVVYGAIAALFGCVLGLAAALLLAMGFGSSPPVRLIVISSAGYFFFIGAARGSNAGFFVSEVLSGIASIAAAEGGVAPDEFADHDEPESWKSPLLLIVWIGIVLVLAWRG